VKPANDVPVGRLTPVETARPARERTRPPKPSVDRLWFAVLTAGGVAALVVSVLRLEGSPIGGSPVGAIRAVAHELSTTGPAALAMALAALVNLAAGVVVARGLRGSSFRSRADAAVGGAAAAVLMDTVFLSVFGSVRAFGWFALAAAHAGVLIVGRWRLRPWYAPERETSDIPGWAWLFPGLVWLSPVLLQLASPVVPFFDVLPNHVAPIEHIRSFGGMASLDVMPSPIYGASRQFIGYVATLGTLSVLSTQPAALAASALILPLTAVSATSVSLVARRWFPGSGRYFVLIAVPLSFVFLRLPDARATVVAFVTMAATAVAFLEPPGRARTVGLAVGLAATGYMHPLLAGLTGLTLVVAGLARGPGRVPDRALVPALAAGTFAILPQLATTMEVGMGTWTAGAAIVAAPTIGWLARRFHVRLAWPAGPVVGLAVALAVIIRWRVVLRAITDAGGDALVAFPILGAGFVLSFLVVRGVIRRAVLAGTLVWFCVAAGLAAAPWADEFWNSLRFEIPNKLMYWVPWVWAFPAAAVAARLWANGRLGKGAVVVATLFATLAIRDQPVGIHDFTEHRLSESVAIAVRQAERGFWVGYPDERRILDETRQALVDAVRSEITAGRLRPTSRVLQVAPSFQQWTRTPVDVFTGAVVTSVSNDPERSGHTRGGRLFGLGDLDRILAEDYSYVIVEGDLVASVGPEVRHAGYSVLWRGAAGIIYER